MKGLLTIGKHASYRRSLSADFIRVMTGRSNHAERSHMQSLNPQLCHYGRRHCLSYGKLMQSTRKPTSLWINSPSFSCRLFDSPLLVDSIVTRQNNEQCPEITLSYLEHAHCTTYTEVCNTRYAWIFEF